MLWLQVSSGDRVLLRIISLFLKFWEDWVLNFVYLHSRLVLHLLISKLHLIRLSHKSSPSFWEEHLLKGVL